MFRNLFTMGLLLSATVAYADEPSADIGRELLLTKSFIPAQWPLKAYDDAWKSWGVGEKPQNYEAAFRERYGLHPAPFDNGKYPMGLIPTPGFFGKGVASNCMLCHGGSIAGKSYIGLGNVSLDVQALFEDMGKAGFGKGKTPFTFCNVRGTSEAGGMSVFLMQYREPDLRLRLKRLDLGLRDDLCEDVPAWWHMRKKKTMYHTGATDARSVRSIMQFMLVPFNLRTKFEKDESEFRHIHAYLKSIEPPAYPFAVNEKLTKKGKLLFNKSCAKCHGTYGEKWTYPNRIVPLDVIGTDRTRFDGISEAFGRHYNKSWFAKEKRPDGKTGYPVNATKGYQAPPLDGVWATAPFFHNGSVPTLYHVLNSKARPKIFTRSFKTDEVSYDKNNVGWKITVLQRPPAESEPAIERRKVYDASQPGRGNGGHRFGDHFSDADRRAVIEYLKTL